MPRRPIRLLAGLVVALLAAAACADGRGGGGSPLPSNGVPATTPSPAASSSPGPSTSPSTVPSPTGTPGGSRGAVRLALEPVADGLDAPLAVTHAGDGSGRLFVVEQAGRIRIVRDGAVEPRPFLDITDRVRAGGERGLLGLAFHPEYPAEPRLFVDYTDLDGDTVIASFDVDPSDPDRVDPDSERVLLRIDQPYANHNGGALAFGPDGYLYISTGDGGGAGDPLRTGRRLDTLLGKLLRIDVDATGLEGANYGIPPDNPFLDEPDALPEIWALGLRNPWRMSFDRATGDLWLGDVGQGRWEEVDVARAGETGLDFGWSRLEGYACYPPGAQTCLDEGVTPPIAVYGHDDGCSVVGGIVYRGAAQPALAGRYLVADYCSGRLWSLDPTAERPAALMPALDTDRSISAIGEDEPGEPYLTDLSGGELLRIVVAD